MNNRPNDDRNEQARWSWKLLGLSFLSGLGGGTSLMKHPDERIAATTQKWAAIGGSFLSVALAISLVVRVFALKQDPSQYWDIGLMWLANMLIVSIGQTRSGIRPVGVGRRQARVSVLLIVEIALLVPAVLWLMGTVHSWQQYVIFAATAGVSGSAMLLLMRAIYSKWERGALGSEPDEEA